MKQVSILNSYRIEESNPILSSGGNIGNSYLCYALEQTLSEHCNITNYDVISDDLGIDLYVINCQDNIRINNENALMFDIDYRKARIISVGLNNFFNDTQVSFKPIIYKNLANSAKVFPIGVRGELTKQYLASFGITSTVIGCPSFYLRESLDIPALTSLPEPSEIMVTGDFSLVNNPGGYFSQGDYDLDLSLKAISDGIKISAGYLLHNKIANPYSPKSGIFPKSIYFLTQLERAEEIFSQFKLTIGSRVHGSIVSLNANVPAVCTNFDLRAIEICSHLGIPHMAFLPPLSSNEFKDVLNTKLEYMVKRQRELRGEYIKYLDLVFS